MNEIIVTIIAGLPYTLITLVCALIVIVYACLLAWSIENKYDWLTTFLIVIPLFFFISGISYFFGSII